MNEEPIVVRSGWQIAGSWVLRIVVTLFVLILFVPMAATLLVTLEAPFHLAFGWIFHAGKALPPLLGGWRAFLLPLGCLVMAGVLIHRFASRWIDAKGSPRCLRPKETVAAISLLLLGSGAAISLSGIVHQAVWLMSEPMTENRGMRADLTATVNDARQLMLALYEYYDENGHYPNALGDLETEIGIPPRLTWARYGTRTVPEPFILLCPGRTRAANEDEPLIVSPVLPRDGKFVVGYGDMSVRTLPATQFSRILRERGKSNDDGR